MKVCNNCGKVISDKKLRRHKQRCGNPEYKQLKQMAREKNRKIGRRNRAIIGEGETDGGREESD